MGNDTYTCSCLSGFFGNGTWCEGLTLTLTFLFSLCVESNSSSSL